MATDVLVVLLVVLLFVAGPNTMGPMRFGPPSPLEWLVPAVGIAWNLLGLGLTIRIYRADPEAHPSWFRAIRH